MSGMQGWNILQIGDLFTSIPGEWGGEGTPEDGVPVLRSTNFRNNGTIDFSDIVFRKIEPVRLSKRRVNNGSVLIEKSGGSPAQPAGRVVFCDRDFGGCASNFIEIATVDESYSSKFVAYKLFHLYQEGLVQKYQQQTTGIINFKLGEYKKEIVVVPESKLEQAKIAEVLSTVDRAIEQTEALIAKQQRIKAGLLQDLLTRGIDEHGNLRSEATHAFKDSPLGRIPVEWEVKSIESMLERIIDYRGRTPIKTDSGVALLTAKNVRDGYLSEEPQEFIAADRFDSWMTRGIPVPGDVMISTEAPMGNVARIPEYRIALAQRLITLQPMNGRLSSNFLFWLLHWKRTLERLEILTSGSTVTGIKQSVFRKVDFAFPRYDEQTRIACILEADKQSREDTERQLSKLRSLKTGLMQDLLSGRKRVTPLMTAEAQG